MRIFLFLFSLLFSSIAISAQDHACVQYQRKDMTWGDSYRVPASLYTGQEMLDATNDYRFNSWSNYVVAEWPNGGYSLFEIPSYQNSLPYSYLNTKDQNNRVYRFKQAPSYGSCSPY